MNSRNHGRVNPLLEARNLSLRYPGRRSPVVDDVSFTLDAGSTLGLVGASGAGKSTVARLLTGLSKPSSGSVLFRGEDLLQMRARGLKPHGQSMQIIFQEPSASLSPRRTVARTLLEPLDHFSCGDASWRQTRIREALATVGLEADALPRYPHQFSAGQQQRIAIARALVTGPELLIADEPVAALDVSVQAQILQLLGRLKREHGIAILFISHDLAVIRQIADEVAVMYRGQLLEQSPAGSFFSGPLHPYSRLLLDFAGDNPPLAADSLRLGRGATGAGGHPGCAFWVECPVRKPVCEHTVPRNHDAGQRLTETSRARMAHCVKCHLYDDESSDDHEE